jgi:hypothetical protein
MLRNKIIGEVRFYLTSDDFGEYAYTHFNRPVTQARFYTLGFGT